MAGIVVKDGGDWEARYREWRAKKIRSEELRKTLKEGINNFNKDKVNNGVSGLVRETISIDSLEGFVRPKKAVVFVISLIIISAVVGAIVYINYDPYLIRYKPIDVEVKNKSGLPMSVYHNDKNLFYLSGWESFLEYGGKKDRLFGNEQYRKLVFDDAGRAYSYIVLDDKVDVVPLTSDPENVTSIGWFKKPEEVVIENKLENKYKEVSAELESEDRLVKLGYDIYREKPYFLANANVFFDDPSKLGEFGLGFVGKDFNVYLPNGNVLKNDNVVIKLDKMIDVSIYSDISKDTKEELKERIGREIDLSRLAVQRKGSSYKFDGLEYQILLNNESKGILVFTDEKADFEVSFLWNVFRIYVSPDEFGLYPSIYFVILDEASVRYEGINGWVLKSKYFNGRVSDYIKLIKSESKGEKDED